MIIVRRFGIALSLLPLIWAVQPLCAQENMPVDLTGTWLWLHTKIGMNVRPGLIRAGIGAFP
jgi:hypothetical protein